MRFELKSIYLGIILVVGIMILAGCTQNIKQESSYVYPGSETYSTPQTYYAMMNIPTQGVALFSYKVSGGNINDILGWYENKLNSTGWTFQDKIPFTQVTTPSGSASYGGILFKKGDTGKGVWAWNIPGETEVYYVVATGPWSKFSQSGEAEQLPSSDQASGYEPLPRYPNSVMLNHYVDTSNPVKQRIQIDYGTEDSADTVSNWYKTQLQNMGWSLDEETSDDSGYSLTFVRNGERAEIAIFSPTETTAYTEIDLTYTNTTIPSSDTASGYEPVSRYPGSVMTKYQTSSFEGTTSIDITYLTKDNISDVENWYKTDLPSQGWQLITSQSQNNEIQLMFSKGSSALTVDLIPSTAYTEIDITYIGS